jgi:hypothetical protein
MSVNQSLRCRGKDGLEERLIGSNIGGGIIAREENRVPGRANGKISLYLLGGIRSSFLIPGIWGDGWRWQIHFRLGSFSVR